MDSQQHWPYDHSAWLKQWPLESVDVAEWRLIISPKYKLLISVLIVIVGIFGIFSMTVLFPLVAALISPATFRKVAVTPAPQSVAIVIPAHNEAALLPETLTSIFEAIRKIGNESTCTFRVVVGADGCTDNTEAEARKMGAEVVVISQQRGKWGTLVTLAKECAQSEWIIFADCGISWPGELLLRLLPSLSRDDIVGVAPSYQNNTSGCVERAVWGTENAIKRIESRSGGPVSVHGATVCYRTRELLIALAILSARNWLNDDIVIPLCLRSLYPSKKILYLPSVAVTEIPKQQHEKTGEFRRRRRLVYGNIEWIRWLWAPLWKHNPTAALLASRRVWRLLWIYWLALTFLPLAYSLWAWSPAWVPVLFSVALCAAAVPWGPKLRALFESGAASALAPLYFIITLFKHPSVTQETPWK